MGLGQGCVEKRGDARPRNFRVIGRCDGKSRGAMGLCRPRKPRCRICHTSPTTRRSPPQIYWLGLCYWLELEGED
ncbi:hypothetical protein Pyn_13836 [Prunus yedoensis var. nudiflora]|uniref:Uncharacterized protein n=1 Tax=Prunus yedoensis var. nudiflora TaxID=2094558 RepID=A0A314UNX4_PRUYE|nr:hypothetical protein Pyn_13836 [Prunus yedoensis var. nudiflora]